MLTSWGRDTCSLSTHTRTPGLGFGRKSGVFCLQRDNREVIHSWHIQRISTCCSIISENSTAFTLISLHVEFRPMCSRLSTSQSCCLQKQERQHLLKEAETFLWKLMRGTSKAGETPIVSRYKYPIVLMRKKVPDDRKPFLEYTLLLGHCLFSHFVVVSRFAKKTYRSAHCLHDTVGEFSYRALQEIRKIVLLSCFLFLLQGFELTKVLPK